MNRRFDQASELETSIKCAPFPFILGERLLVRLAEVLNDRPAGPDCSDGQRHARLSFLIPFCALSLRFLRVAGHPLRAAARAAGQMNDTGTIRQLNHFLSFGKWLKVELKAGHVVESWDWR